MRMRGCMVLSSVCMGGLRPVGDVLDSAVRIVVLEEAEEQVHDLGELAPGHGLVQRLVDVAEAGRIVAAHVRMMEVRRRREMMVEFEQADAAFGAEPDAEASDAVTCAVMPDEDGL